MYGAWRLAVMSTSNEVEKVLGNFVKDCCHAKGGLWQILTGIERAVILF